MGGGESDRIKPEYEPYTQGYCLVKCECDSANSARRPGCELMSPFQFVIHPSRDVLPGLIIINLGVESLPHVDNFE